MVQKKRQRARPTALERATRALAVNKRRLDATSPMGLASDKTLAARGYDPDPAGGGPTVPIPGGKRRKKRQR